MKLTRALALASALTRTGFSADSLERSWQKSQLLLAPRPAHGGGGAGQAHERRLLALAGPPTLRHPATTSAQLVHIARSQMPMLRQANRRQAQAESQHLWPPATCEPAALRSPGHALAGHWQGRRQRTGELAAQDSATSSHNIRWGQSMAERCLGRS